MKKVKKKIRGIEFYASTQERGPSTARNDTVGEEEEQEEEEETLRFFNNTAGPQVLLQVCETDPGANTPCTVSETCFFHRHSHHNTIDFYAL